MDWLTQNWIYLLLLAGVVVFMRFGGMGCGMAGRRAHPEHKPGAQPGPGETRENRDRFEAVPDKDAKPASGQQAEQGHRGHGGGCC